MKTHFLLLLYLLLINCKNYNNKIDIKYNYGNTTNKEPIRHSILKVYSNDSLYFEKSIREDIQTNKNIIIHSLPNEKLTLEYSLLDGTIKKENIDLTKEISKKINIEFNNIKYENFNSNIPINNLKNGEKYIMFAKNTRGPASFYNSFTITKEHNNYYFQSIDNPKRKLNNKNIQALKKFESELYYLNKKGIASNTTGFIFTFTKNNKTDTLVEFTSNWHGLSELYKNINN